MVANNVRIDATPEFLALILDAAQKVESHIKVIGFWLVWPLVSTIIKLESEPLFHAETQSSRSAATCAIGQAVANRGSRLRIPSAPRCYGVVREQRLCR